ncbi:hypothetical protein [Nitrobacter sp. TKz-YC02]|uniref:hypothetical protein n=1 Tax=Nitrobacter sp. TKz-YC02 TaxID=3398704 RepID=UPI003CE8C0EB
MSASALTVAQIDANIALVREQISMMEDEARELSLPAVAGDEQARTLLANVRTKIQQAEADFEVLADARISALGRDHEAAEAKDADYRARQLQIARERAAAIVQLASRADGLVAEFKALISDMRGVELGIWKAAREAGQPADGAIVGRKNIDQFAIDQLLRFANGTDRFGKERPVAEWARQAWRHLLTDEAHND